MEAFSVEADVPGGPHAGARARRLVESELTGRLSGELLGDVCLLVTELIANGVRHGGGIADASLHLALRGGGAGLHVEVVNADHSRRRVAPRRADLAGGGGLGLQLVERLASRWGVRDSPRTVVWFEVDC